MKHHESQTKPRQTRTEAVISAPVTPQHARKQAEYCPQCNQYHEANHQPYQYYLYYPPEPCQCSHMPNKMPIKQPRRQMTIPTRNIAGKFQIGTPQGQFQLVSER